MSQVVRLTQQLSDKPLVVSSKPLTYAAAPTGPPLGSWVGWMGKEGHTLTSCKVRVEEPSNQVVSVAKVEIVQELEKARSAAPE